MRIENVKRTELNQMKKELFSEVFSGIFRLTALYFFQVITVGFVLDFIGPCLLKPNRSRAL